MFFFCKHMVSMTCMFNWSIDTGTMYLFRGSFLRFSASIPNNPFKIKNGHKFWMMSVTLSHITYCFICIFWKRASKNLLFISKRRNLVAIYHGYYIHHYLPGKVQPVIRNVTFHFTRIKCINTGYIFCMPVQAFMKQL